MSSQAIQDEVREAIREPARAAARVMRELRWVFRVIVSAVDRFYWDNGFGKAASLAYTTLLSLVPVTALAVMILTSILTSRDDVSLVSRFIFRQFLPQLEIVDPHELPSEGRVLIVPRDGGPQVDKSTRRPVEISDKALDRVVMKYLSEFGDTLRGLNQLVLVFIVVTCILLLNSIEYALNEVWQVFEPRSIAHRIGIFCAIIVIAPVFVLSAYYSTNFLHGIGIAGYWTNVYNYLLPFVIDFLAFLALYYLVPKAPVKLRSAYFGAFLAALLFAGAKALFAMYIMGFSSYARIYETLAVIPIFLFWLYLSWAIVLFGAETSFQAQHLPHTGRIWKRSLLSIGDGQLLLAMQALTLISEAFLRGSKPPNDLELCEKLGCSSVVLKPALAALEKAEIVSRGEVHAQPLTLMRSPDKIRLAEIREALYRGRPAVHCPGQMAKLFSHFAMDEKVRSATLADIVRDGCA